MPLFSRKKRDSDLNGVLTGEESPTAHRSSNGTVPKQSTPPPANGGIGGRPTPAVQQQSQPTNDQLPVQRPKLVFHCQQAQGSPTGIISGFTNVMELYEKISECYDFPPSDILFCTLNTHKPDMTKLLGGQIGLDDFIFVHRKGQPKEVEVIKTEDALGLTITDNGTGYAFIKRIKEGSLMERIGYVQVGDHIEKIDSTSFIGSRHFQVAKALKEIPKGATFTLRLIEPLKAGFSHIGPKSGTGTKKASYGSGKETLRLRATGPATVEEAPNDVVQSAVEKLNNLLESFMGINDSELATQIWELGKDLDNPHTFVTAIAGSELEVFGFTDDFVFDLWGAISDAKAGRLKKDMLADTIF